MEPEQFTEWMSGYCAIKGLLSPVEGSQKAPPSQEQWDVIMTHLRLVFEKSRPPDYKSERIDGLKDLMGGER